MGLGVCSGLATAMIVWTRMRRAGQTSDKLLESERCGVISG
jgi:hypothetical protein